MISFDSDNYTCFPVEELNNECKLCKKKLVMGLSTKGHVSVNHVVKSGCCYAQINKNYNFYLMHSMIGKPYPRPISNCPKCGDVVIYMWYSKTIGKWFHVNGSCNMNPDIFSKHNIELATILLLFHLIEGFRPKVRAACDICQVEHYHRLPKLGYIDKGFTILLNGGVFILSLCCYNLKGKLIGVIEIGPYYKEVSDFCETQGLFLYKLYTYEIIKRLDRTKPDYIPIFNNKIPINCQC